MKLKTLHLVCAIFCIFPAGQAPAGEHRWPLDSWPAAGLQSHGGDVKMEDGAVTGGLALDGRTTIQADPLPLSSPRSLTASIWLNAYAVDRGQQMFVAKNRYSLNEREWGVMIDRDGRIKLYVWQGKWLIVDSGHKPQPGRWQHVLVRITHTSADLWINGKKRKSAELKKPVAAAKAPLTFGGVNDNGRIWQNLFGALDDARLYDRALSDAEAAALYHPVTAVHQIPEPPKPKVYALWSGPTIPANPSKIPFAEGIEHRTIHDARTHDYKFLHGAAIINYKGTFFANWANSPTNENGPQETLQGRRSTDGCASWSDMEVIGPGFKTSECHSHGVLMEHKGALWAISARFGAGPGARRFPGLKAEAFVLNEKTDRWESRGIVMSNCWPYDQPVRMDNGNFITGGQDKDGLPVVAISHGDDLMKWDSILIPYPPALKPSFAETTVWAEGKRVLAVIRGGGGVAWVATSDDYGQTWAEAQPSNLPMPRAKAYLGKLSTGQLYLLSNFGNRDTLVVSVSRPGEKTLSSMWRIRHGRSEPPRFKGRAKAKQWSYPYGVEHDGKLYVVYSVGKEDCGLSVIPVSSLKVAHDRACLE